MFGTLGRTPGSPDCRAAAPKSKAMTPRPITTPGHHVEQRGGKPSGAGPCGHAGDRHFHQLHRPPNEQARSPCHATWVERPVPESARKPEGVRPDPKVASSSHGEDAERAWNHRKLRRPSCDVRLARRLRLDRCSGSRSQKADGRNRLVPPVANFTEWRRRPISLRPLCGPLRPEPSRGNVRPSSRRW